MVDLEDLSDFEWCLEHLTRLRSKWLEVDAIEATSTRESLSKSIEKEAILEQFGKYFKRWYFPSSGFKTSIMISNKPRWAPDSWSIYFEPGMGDRRDRIQAYLIEHPVEFLEMIKCGIDTTTREQQDKEFEELREKAEQMITQFAPILVSDEFL